MLIRDALLTAARFAEPIGKERSALSGVRLIPRTDQYRARVYAASRDAAVLLDLDPDLDVPNLVVDAHGIETAARQEPDATVRVDQAIVKLGRYWFRPWCSVGDYPGFRRTAAPETFETIEDPRGFAQVLHAVGQDPGRPELHYCSVRPGYCEATDGTRLARATLQTQRTVQIHPAVFESWPGGPVGLAVDGESVEFRWPDQHRWTHRYPGGARPYPDLSRIPDDRVDETDAVVPVAAFRAVVRRAQQASPTKVVAVRVGRGAAEVAAVLDVKLKPGGYEARVPALCRGTADLMVGGPALAAALAAVETPRVLLGFCGPTEPLVLRAGHYTEHLYPMLA